MKQTNLHSIKEVTMDIENPMPIATKRATHFSKKLFSILLHNKISMPFIYVIVYALRRLFKSQRMKRKALTLLMAFSLVLLMMAGKIIR